MISKLEEKLKDKLKKIKNSKYAIETIVISIFLSFIMGVFIGIVPSCHTRDDNDSLKAEINKKNRDIEALSKKVTTLDDTITKLNSKVKSAQPWFEMNEDIKKIAIDKLNKEKEEKLAQEKAKQDANDKKAKQESEEKTSLETKLSKGVDTNKIKLKVESIIKKELDDQVINTTLNSVTINENLGTDSNKDVVVLCYFSWSTKNTEKMTKEMLEMYSDNFAAIMAREIQDGSEIALFWKAEYTGLDLKYSYLVKNGKAYRQ